MPSGTRISQPVSTGLAVCKPNSVAFRPCDFLIGMAITANIIQTMKQTVKAQVLTIRTEMELPQLVAAWFQRTSQLKQDGDVNRVLVFFCLNMQRAVACQL